MIRRFLNNAALLLALNLLVKGTYLFGIDRTVQNRLPEGDYGLFFSLLGLSMLFQVVADFGLQLYSARSVSGDRARLEAYFPDFVGLKLLLGVAYFSGILLAAVVLGYGGEARDLLWHAAAIQFLASSVLYLRSNLSGLGWFRLDSLFSVLDKTIVILVVGAVLIWFPEQLDIWFFAQTQGLGLLVSAGVLLAVLSRRLPRKRPRFERARLAGLLRGGAPFALAIFLQTAYTRTDAVMIERILTDGAAAAGHYAAGYRLLDALNIFGWLLAGLLLPMYARLQAERKDFRPLLVFSTRLLLAVGLIAALPLAFYAGPVTAWLYGFAEARTGAILALLALSFVAQCGNYAYGSLLSGMGLIGRMNWVFAGAIGVNVVGNWLVLPVYGAVGAAAVTLGTQAGVAVVQGVLTGRWLGIGDVRLGWWRLGVLTSVLVGAGWALRTSDWDWEWGFLGLGILGTVTALALRLINVREAVGSVLAGAKR